MRQAGVIRNTMAYARSPNPMVVRLEQLEQRLSNLILKSKKTTYPGMVEDAILSLTRSGIDERTVRQAAVHICSARLNCLECRPLPGCKSRV